MGCCGKRHLRCFTYNALHHVKRVSRPSSEYGKKGNADTRPLYHLFPYCRHLHTRMPCCTQKGKSTCRMDHIRHRMGTCRACDHAHCYRYKKIPGILNNMLCRYRMGYHICIQATHSGHHSGGSQLACRRWFVLHCRCCPLRCR